MVTVRELIEKLNNLKQDQEIVIGYDHFCGLRDIKSIVEDNYENSLYYVINEYNMKEEDDDFLMNIMKKDSNFKVIEEF